MIVFHAKAKEEVRSATRYYAAKRPILGSDLANDLQATLRRIERHPIAYAPDKHGLRRAILRTFPFKVLYSVEDDGTIFVIAFAHHRRKPDYWLKRIQS